MAKKGKRKRESKTPRERERQEREKQARGGNLIPKVREKSQQKNKKTGLFGGERKILMERFLYVYAHTYI